MCMWVGKGCGLEKKTQVVLCLDLSILFQIRNGSLAT